jgi:hypothetical protein
MNQPDIAANGLVELLLRQYPTLERSFNFPVVQTGTGHLQIDPGIDPSDPTIRRSPIGHDQHFKAPFPSQYVQKEPSLFTAIYPVELIVGAQLIF